MVYPGGKNGAGVFQRIINLMPPHHCYVEAFLGSGAILRMKRPATHNVAIDRDDAALDGCRELIQAGARIAGSDVAFRQGDALELLPDFSDPDTLIYCDPPYLPSTRTGGDLYRFEMTEEDHVRLLQLLTASDAMVMLSGYRAPLYDQALTGWQSIDYETQTRGGLKTETLWWNFPEPTVLHDYSYLGIGFRERERIKRKKARWVARLAKMDRLERQAVLAAIEEGEWK